MMKLALALTLVASTLAGCGASIAPTAAPKAGRTAIAHTAAKAPVVVVTSATAKIVVGAPQPGHNYNERERFDIAGKRDGKPFSLVLLTHNPQGNQYVANVEKLTVNGQAVTNPTEQKAWGDALIQAANRDAKSPWAVRIAAQVLHFAN